MTLRRTLSTNFDISTKVTDRVESDLLTRGEWIGTQLVFCQSFHSTPLDNSYSLLFLDLFPLSFHSEFFSVKVPESTNRLKFLHFEFQQNNFNKHWFRHIITLAVAIVRYHKHQKTLVQHYIGILQDKRSQNTATNGYITQEISGTVTPPWLSTVEMPFTYLLTYLSHFHAAQDLTHSHSYGTSGRGPCLAHLLQ